MIYWESSFCLTPIDQLFSLYYGETNLRFDEIIMESAELDLYGTSSLKQQCRYGAPADTLSWFRANHCYFLLLNAVCAAEKQQIPML